jgi:hypothetical protein
MKYVTRARARVDRIACAWLIRRFIDPEAEILYVPPSEVMTVAGCEGALPFDVPGVELGHHGALCSFDAFRRLRAPCSGVADVRCVVRVLPDTAILNRGVNRSRPASSSLVGLRTGDRENGGAAFSGA